MRTSGSELTVEGQFRTGEQTVALHVALPPKDMEVPYQHAILARLNATGSPPDALQTGLGGPENVPAGGTAYATIDLTPGRYAWVFFHPTKENLIHEFTVE